MIQTGDMIHDRYRVIRKLGEGACAETFEVEDTAEDDYKVIKILKENWRSNQRVRKLFAREYEILKQFDHPGIPKVKIDGYVAITYNRHSQVLTIPGLVMEKIDGENLREWLGLESNKKIINTKQAIQWLKELIDILDYIHSHKYVHRDIKPSNIMLKPNGQLVLIDFGIVKELTQQYERQNNPNTEVGTPGYAPPEQLRATLEETLLILDSGLDHRADFFSLGRTFVHLLTGISPDNLRDPENGNKLSWQYQAPEIDEDFKDLIDILMEHEPGKRPKNTQEIKQKIKKLLEEKPPIAVLGSVNNLTPNFLPTSDEEAYDGSHPSAYRYNIPIPIIFCSFALNIVLLILLTVGVTLNIGLKVLFVVVLCVIFGFLVKPLMKDIW